MPKPKPTALLPVHPNAGLEADYRRKLDDLRKEANGVATALAFG